MNRRLERIESLAVGGLALVALLSALYGMLARYLVPELSSDWAEEITIYALLWSIWLASARLVVADAHVKSELLSRFAGARLTRMMTVVHAALGFGFCAVIAWFGLDVVRLAVALGERSDSSLQFPMAFYYLSMPVGLALMALGYGTRLVHRLRYPVVSNDGESA